jgi:hypothetical protein
VPFSVPEGDVPGEDWLGYPTEPTELTVRTVTPTAEAAAAASHQDLRAGMGSASSRGRLSSAGRGPRSPNASLGAPWERPGSSGLHRAHPQGIQGFHANEPRPSSRSAAERLHASAEHFPNPMVLAPLLPGCAGHASEGPRGGKSRRQTPARSPARSPARGGAAAQRNKNSPTNLGPAWNQNFGAGQSCQGNATSGAPLPDVAAASVATPNLPTEVGITGWG